MTETKPFSVQDIRFEALGAPRYEQLAQAVECAIREGRLVAGGRLPPIRRLAEDLGISVTTVTAAFEVLNERGLIRAKVGRGTFVAQTSAPPRPAVSPAGFPRQGGRPPWRRRALMSLGARLHRSYPSAADCSTGRPDVSLHPIAIMKRACKSAIEAATAVDLQYAGPEAIEALARPLVSLLDRDGIAARADGLVIGSSAQQLMMLSLEVAAQISGGEKAAVAVEEPGYPTIMDAYERAGARLIGVAVDELGAVPASLDSALEAGAMMALVTPRAHNPTGASWSPERRAALADVLADHPNVLAVEDDQFADIATTRPGSLLNDDRVAERVVYVRSFSKSIGPDLRIAAAAARPRLWSVLAEAKTLADGWTSRLLQRALAAVLADDEFGESMDSARESYRERRRRAAEALNQALQAHGGWTWCGPDGLNLWVHLPPGVDAIDVVERAAASGVRVAPGEPFFIRPGHSNAVRLNAGSVPADQAAHAGRLAAEAAIASRLRGVSLIHV